MKSIPSFCTRSFVIQLMLAFNLLTLSALSVHASIAFGSINNFDTVNDTGKECHGFEIELEDCHSTDITYTYNWNHYGVPIITEDNSTPGHPKCIIRWEAKLTGTAWSAYTAIPVGPIAPTDGHQFTNPAVNFGGEHFGVGYRVNPTVVRYNWLVDNGSGVLVGGGQVNISTPVFTYVPAAPGVAAQVQAAIAPPPPIVPDPLEFGQASWVKEIRTTSHNPNAVALRDLVSDDPDNANDKNWANGEPSEVESEWALLQTDYNKADGGVNAKLAGAPEGLPNGNEVITRRYEFFKYTGPIDNETGEAMCDSVGPDGIHGVGGKVINGVSVDLSTVEVVGEYSGAQMAGADVGGELGLIDHLQAGEQDIPYVDRTVVIPGNAPFEATTEGALPAGMSFDSVTGIVSGTPTESGQFVFKVMAVDGISANVSKSYALSIAAPGVDLPVQYLVNTAVTPVATGTTTGDGAYALDAGVTVTATPDAGFVFSNWTENDVVVSSSASYTFTIIVNRELVAHFVAGVTRTINTSADPIAGGTTSGGGIVTDGSSVTVVATANAGYTFSSWMESGTTASGAASYNFTAGADRTLVAHFTDNQPPTISGSFSPLSILAGSLPDYTGQAVTDDNVGVMNVTQTPQPNSPVSPGLVTVTLTAHDAAGNSADATFDVTVQSIEVAVTTEQFGSASGTASAVPGEPAGSTFKTFGVPFINDAGVVAYTAKIRIGAVSQDVMFSGSAVVLRKGDTANDASGAALPGVTFGSFKDPVLAADGAMGFLAKLSGTGVVNTNDNGAWMKSSGTFVQIVREGGHPQGVAPETALKSIASLVLSGSGVEHTAYFTGKLAIGPGGVATTNDSVIYRWDEGTGLALVMREGDPLVLSSGSTKTVKAFRMLANILGSSGQARGSSKVEAATFHVTFSDNTQAVVDAAAGGVEDLAATGGGVAGFVWQKFGAVATSNSGGAAFAGSLQTGIGGVSTATARGIFLATDLLDPEAVARTGDATPGIAGSTFSIFKDPLLAPGSFDVAFIATAKGGSAMSTDNTGLWWRPEGSPLQLVARENATLIGAPELSQLRAFTSSACSNRGPLFTGKLRVGTAGAAGPGGVLSTDDTMLWGMNSSNVLQKLLAEGDSLSVGGTQKAVKNFTVLSAVPGAFGVRRSFTAEGSEVIVRVNFTDYTQAIVKIAVP